MFFLFSLWILTFLLPLCLTLILIFPILMSVLNLLYLPHSHGLSIQSITLNLICPWNMHTPTRSLYSPSSLPSLCPLTSISITTLKTPKTYMSRFAAVVHSILISIHLAFYLPAGVIVSVSVVCVCCHLVFLFFCVLSLFCIRPTHDECIASCLLDVSACVSTT
jgi:hypothetical protein